MADVRQGQDYDFEFVRETDGTVWGTVALTYGFTLTVRASDEGGNPRRWSIEDVEFEGEPPEYLECADCPRTFSIHTTAEGEVCTNCEGELIVTKARTGTDVSLTPRHERDIPYECPLGRALGRAWDRFTLAESPDTKGPST